MNRGTVTTPPNDIDAEAAMIGSLLVDESAIPSVAAMVKPEDIYSEIHREVYVAILGLATQRQAVDLLTVEGALERAGKLETVGGAAFLGGLTSIPTAMNASTYAMIVSEMAERRRLLAAAQSMAKAAYAVDIDMPTVRRQAMGVVTSALRPASGSISAVSLESAADKWFAEFKELVVSGHVTGTETGVPALDRLTNGYRAGRLMVFAAPPGGGKSTMMKVSAVHAARRLRRQVCVWTLEMPEHEYWEMIISEWMRKDLSPKAVLDMSPDRRREILQEVEEATSLAKHTLKNYMTIRYAPGATVEQMLLEARELKMSRGIDLVIVDYLQIVRPDRARGQNREQEVASIALALKEMAGELRVPVVAASQLNDQGQVRESRAIEQHCDGLVIFENTLEGLTATIKKNRRGATDKLPLMFRKDISHIGGVSRSTEF